MPIRIRKSAITGDCPQCHSQDKYFVLDKDHNTRCVTCHVRNDCKTYTCFGCHEHTPANIRRKHVEEGISKYGNCVECHRTPDFEISSQVSGARQSMHPECHGLPRRCPPRRYAPRG